MRPLIAYVRVSTSKQGKSGLGLEAQKEALSRFAEAEGFEIVRVFVEVETGKGSDAIERRPQLAAALAEARRKRCSIGVAKLERLSRDVHFISGLMTHRVPFVVAELGCRRRSIYPSSVCCPRRERARFNQRADESGIGCGQGPGRHPWEP